MVLNSGATIDEDSGMRNTDNETTSVIDHFLALDQLRGFSLSFSENVMIEDFWFMSAFSSIPVDEKL
jgi:hypothetical protein